MRTLLRILFNFITIPIHSFNDGWPSGECHWCGYKTGLDPWQIAQMPKSMAYCPGGRRVFRFCLNFDCRDDSLKKSQKLTR